MISPLRDLPAATTASIQINSNTSDRSGSDLSTSVISNDSSIFDNISMSDVSSIPSDTEDHDVDYKHHPPRISSKTYMHQTTETIEEDPDEDSENGDQATKSTVSSRPTTSPSLHLNTQVQDDDKLVEMKLYRYEGNLSVANGNISAENGIVNSPASISVTPETPLTSAKREKSFFHLPKLNRSKSQVTLPAEAKSHSLKDQIKNVFHSTNNSPVAVSRSAPESQSTSPTGTPHVDARQPSPQHSPQRSPVTQSTAPPTLVQVLVESRRSVQI